MNDEKISKSGAAPLIRFNDDNKQAVADEYKQRDFDRN